MAGTATSINFVATKHVFCHNKSMLVATNIMLLRQARVSLFVTIKCLLPWQKYACHDKTFVMTNTCLLWQICVTTKIFCCGKHTFVVTKEVFCHNKHICHDKTFVMTKMILVAALTNDRQLYKARYSYLTITAVELYYLNTHTHTHMHARTSALDAHIYFSFSNQRNGFTTTRQTWANIAASPMCASGSLWSASAC